MDVFGLNLEEVKNVLRTDFDEVTEWFYGNYITPNAEKCHFMCLEKDTSNETFILKSSIMKNNKEQKKFGVTIGN